MRCFVPRQPLVTTQEGAVSSLSGILHTVFVSSRAVICYGDAQFIMVIHVSLLISTMCECTCLHVCVCVCPSPCAWRWVVFSSHLEWQKIPMPGSTPKEVFSQAYTWCAQAVIVLVSSDMIYHFPVPGPTQQYHQMRKWQLRTDRHIHPLQLEKWLESPMMMLTASTEMARMRLWDLFSTRVTSRCLRSLITPRWALFCVC